MVPLKWWNPSVGTRGRPCAHLRLHHFHLGSSDLVLLHPVGPCWDHHLPKWSEGVNAMRRMRFMMIHACWGHKCKSEVLNGVMILFLFWSYHSWPSWPATAANLRISLKPRGGILFCTLLHLKCHGIISGYWFFPCTHHGSSLSGVYNVIDTHTYTYIYVYIYIYNIQYINMP